MWSEEQRYRLAFEKKNLEREMPQFRFHNLGPDDSYVEGVQGTSQSSRLFTLRLVLSAWYPDEEPLLLVTHPHRLYKRHSFSSTVNDEGRSHAFHTWENGPGGFVSICHGDWDPSRSWVGVMLKGCLWLEAYELYLKTGESIADILDEWLEKQPYG